MTVPIPVPAPMEAKLVAELPEGRDWHYEPKWDGFRALVRRTGEDVEILSKSGKSLARYFPEIVAMIATLGENDFILDGELIIEIDGVVAFDALQARLHPAPSRVTRLSLATPARLMLFDILRRDGVDLASQPFRFRRTSLADFHHQLDSHIGASRSEAIEAICSTRLLRCGGSKGM